MRTHNPSHLLKSSLLALAALAALAAQGQPTNMPAVFLPTLVTYTNYVPDNTNYAVPSGAIGSLFFSEIGVHARYQRMGAGTNGVTFQFSAGLFQTNLSPVAAVALPANGTNWAYTNFTVQLGALGYFQFDGPNVSSNNNAVTNLEVYVTPKPSRRD